MSRRVIQVENRNIIFSSDDQPPLVDRIQAMVKLRITDELTAEPPDSLITLAVREKGYTPRVADNGLAGVVGIPRQVVPGLNSQDYFVNLTIAARNYLTRQLNQKIPKDLTFPPHFAAQQVNLEMHREPVTILGRTVRLNTSGASVPLAGAQISVTGIWRTAPATIVSPDPPNIAYLRPPLYSDRDATTQTLRPRDFPFAVGPAKSLLTNVSAGASAILLSDRQGLSNGDVLAIDVDRVDLTEFVEIATVPTTSSADQPTLITLNHGLMQPHRRDSVVKQTLPQPPGAFRPFTVAGVAGDSLIFLGNVTGLTNGHEVQITGVAGKDEYHRVMTFSVLSDPEGYYRLPPLSRVAQVEVHAEKTVGIQTFQTTTVFRPDYHQRENRLDLTLEV
jgi:hypothetical protein